jgi:hypothetical protein
MLKFNRSNLVHWYVARSLLVVAAWLLAVLVSTPTARAARVGIYVLAPSPGASLNSVEKHGADPRFEKEFSILYDPVESLIRDEIKKKVDGSPDGTAGCPSIFCPDLNWRVTVTSGFAFTEEGQPEVTYDPQQNGVNITVTAKAKLTLDAASKVWNPADSASYSIHKEYPISIDGSAKLNLWPTLQSEEPSIRLLDDNGNVIDLTNPGVLPEAFEPPTFQVTAVFGYPGSVTEDAEKQINAQGRQRLYAALKTIEEQVIGDVGKHIDAAIQQPINLKEQLLNKKLPVVAKSWQELSDAFGLTFDVRPVLYPGTVNMVVTVRFSGAEGSAKLTGKLRLPKERCTYVIGVGGLIVYALPTGLEKMNTDLAAKVGNSCSSIFPASSIKVSGYLGADPKVIVPGWASTALPTWKAVGNLSFIGNLIDQTTVPSSEFFGTGYYECGFEISSLPNAAIIELITSSPLLEMLGDYARPSKTLRYLEIEIPGQKIVLDSNWKLVDTTSQGLVMGGVGQCTPLSIVDVLQVFENFPPEGCSPCKVGIENLKDACPQCGFKKLREGLYEATSPLALTRNPKFKWLMDALKADEQSRLQLRMLPPQPEPWTVPAVKREQ